MNGSALQSGPPTADALLETEVSARDADLTLLLILTATERLASRVQPALPVQVRARGHPLRAGWFQWCQLAFAVVVLLSFVGVSVMRSLAGGHEPGVVVDASRFVPGGTEEGRGRLFLTAVALPAGASGKVLAGKKLGMDESRRRAIAAATRCLGIPETSAPKLDTGHLSGASGGLMLALLVFDALVSTDLTGGRDIAGTGTIREDGIVGDVVFVGHKARAAEQAGTDIFLVPQGQLSQAQREANSMRVVAVRTLDEAIEALTGSGCRAPLQQPASSPD